MAKFRREQTALLQILVSLCLICLLPQCFGQELNAKLTATESTATLTWNVEPNGTFYQVIFHRNGGFFLTYEYYNEPFPADGKLEYKVTDLLPGVSYFFILFRNGNHSSDRVFNDNVVTIPLPPENLEVLNRTSESVILSWEPGYNSSQHFYEVEYQADGSIQTVQVNVTADPYNFNLTDLMPGHTYLLSMKAVAHTARSNSSSTVTAVTAPGMPENLNVTAINTTTLQAAWDAGKNSLQDSYEVSYKAEGQSSDITTSCTDSPCEFTVGGAPGQLYTVSVFAVQQTFHSVPAVVQHNTAPAPPGNLDGTGGVRTLNLTWDVPSQGVFESFRVSLTNAFENSMSVYEVQKQGGDSNYRYSVTGLVGGVNFFVRVYSVTATEVSVDFASHLYFTLPEPVSGLAGQALNTTAVQLSWQNPFDSEYTGLDVNLTSASGFAMTFTLSAGDLTYAVGGLDPGVEYTAVVVVKSKVQVDSDPVSTTFRTKPEAPQLVTHVSQEESLEITLSGGTNQNGVFDSIKAKLVEDGTLLTADIPGLLTFTSLTPGTQYTLDAYTMSGLQASQSLSELFYTKPRPPQNLQVEVVTSENLLITWDAPDNGGVDNYTVTLVPSHGAEVPKVEVVSDLTYSFTTAHPGETYNVSVVANKGTESSSAIMEQNTTTPLPLMHVRISMKGTDFAVISWDTPSGSVFDGFAYDFKFFNETLAPLGPEPLSVRFESLEANSNYTVTLYVYSNRVDGTVLYSKPVDFNFSTYPESVAALQKVNATSNSITVNWTAPVSGNFIGYQLGINPDDSPISVIGVLPNKTEHTFEGLKAGKNYTVAIRTVIVRSQFGVAVRLQAVTSPLPVMGLAVQTMGADALEVSWTVNVSSSNQDRFTVHQDRDGSRRSQQAVAVQGQSEYEIVLDQLLAGTTYNITVTAIREIETDIEESQPMSDVGTTKPKPAENVTVTSSNQLVTVTWSPAPGSSQSSYRIRYRPTLRDPSAAWLEQTALAPATQFSQVFPGEKYEITIYANSGSQESDPTSAYIVVAPLPPAVSVAVAMTTTESVTLTWIHDPSATYLEYWTMTYRDTQMSQTHNVSRIEGKTSYSKELTSLTPGVTYTVEVKAVVQGVMSTTTALNATARPVIYLNIKELTAETTSSEITFQYNVTNDDVFDSFRFTLLGNSNVLPKIKAKGDPDRKVKFNGLQPGWVYTVEAVTISAGVVSDPVTKKILTVPSNVNVNFQNESTEIIVNFAIPTGEATKFRVRCFMPNNASCWDKTVTSDASNVIIKTLQSYTNYTITVTTIAGDVDVGEKFVEKSYHVRTMEAAPGQVRQLTVVEDGLRTVQLTWLPPSNLNGKLRSYRLEYTGTHRSGLQHSGEQSQLPASVTKLTLSDLKAGYTYQFSIQAMTVSLGPAGKKTVTLSTDAPVFKAEYTPESGKPVKPATAPITETSMSVELVNAFSDDNGPIIGYVVIVSKDPSVTDSSGTLPSWSQARNDGTIIAYQATDRCPNLFQENTQCGKSRGRTIRAANEKDSIEFQVGAQPAADCSAVNSYCNGPLQAGTEYYVKLRAFTDAGFTDTEYSSKIRTADAPETSSAVVPAVVSVVVILIIVVVVVVVFIVIRKRRPKRATKYSGAPTSGGRHSFESSPLKNFSRPVRLSDFPEHVRKMGADSDFKYAEEYEDLKEVGRDQTCYAAELPANRPKNRFTNILPYDHSRVKLLPTDDEEGSDYINANYMPGYTSKREYIATQGPLPATRDDFWRMVWEQNGRNIVMLTRCMEKGREKSDHYWPSDSEPKFYGDLQVVVLNETHMPDWTITEFRMSLGDNCRQIRHFHYKAWPDFGVPKNHTSLIRFVRTVREKLMKDGGPIITHCSAGVGRSGTFIVLDHCLRLVRDKDEVDIFSIVYNLRRERVLMVQTEQQYKFIHECLACVLEGKEDEATYANLGQLNIGFEGEEIVFIFNSFLLTFNFRLNSFFELKHNWLNPLISCVMEFNQLTFSDDNSVWQHSPFGFEMIGIVSFSSFVALSLL
ncbi:tyrosine-protein phosphatase 10D-like [Littorina saxatilis]|uniref:tyrosine-protein phosphatase 10D-like n=1 Tax=Littorina saxatilis TaxID=31220 RepID=UPI0038B43C04